MSVAVTLAACADLGKAARQYTYPPDFTYIPADRLHSAMWQIAEQIRWLDATLRDDATAEPQRQRTVVRLLDQLQSDAGQLAAEGGVTNHPLLDKHLPRLRDDIALARDAAASNPPRYALAGAVAGACIYCHELRVPDPPTAEHGK